MLIILITKGVLSLTEFYNIKGRDEDPFCTLATKLMIQLESMIKNKTGNHKACIDFPQ